MMNIIIVHLYYRKFLYI